MNKKLLSYIFLFIICIAAFFIALPSINQNAGDPNAIVYFNNDEGYPMTLIWLYYSGEEIDSFFGYVSYGLELRYLADIARLTASFVEWTPWTFIFIFRWFHLFAWIGALIALWHLVSYHFGKSWQPLLAVALLSVRPAFSHLLDTSKPDGLVLLIMIIGLNYTLRIIKNPSRKNLFLAVACSSAAFVIKTTGLFLLPPIIIAFYLAKRQRSNESFGADSKLFKISQFFLLLVGSLMVMWPLILICFYVRNSTGATWYEGVGLWESLRQNKLMLLPVCTGIFVMFLSLLLWLLNKSSNFSLKKIANRINKINYCSFIVSGIFLIFTIFFGFRWITNPQYFLITYSRLGGIFFGAKAAGTATGAALYSFLQNMIVKIQYFDPIIFVIFLFFICMGIYKVRRNKGNGPLEFDKRTVLFIFLIPFFMMLLGGRMVSHHMIPFFVVISLLVIQGIDIFINRYNRKRLAQKVVVLMAGLLFAADIGLSGTVLIRARIDKYNQKYDIAYDVAKWMKDNIPLDAPMVADHPTRIYLPAEYTNVRVFDGHLTHRREHLRTLVKTHRPKFVYYNVGPSGALPMPPLEEILPDRKVRLIKVFNSEGRFYQRRAGDKFVIYELLN